MKPILTASLLFLMSNLCNAQEFTVTDINAKSTRAEIKANDHINMNDRLQFTDKFGERCIGTVVKKEAQTAILDIAGCSHAQSIKNGVLFKKFEDAPAQTTPAAPTYKPYVSDSPTIDESWYTLWGLGFSGINYSNNDIDNEFDYVDKQPGVDRSSGNADLFGFYWPRTRTDMHGFVYNVIVDTLDNNVGDSFTLSQSLFAYSYYHFFGVNIGDQWFLRGDIGFSRFKYEAENSYITVSDETKTGMGALFGGGYGFATGLETRFLLGGYVTYRKGGDMKASAFNVTGAFLF